MKTLSLLTILPLFAISVYAADIKIPLADHVDVGEGEDGTRGITLLNNTLYTPRLGPNGLHFLHNKAKLVENGTPSFVLNNANYAVYATGSPATITSAQAALEFAGSGRMDPSVTLTSPGMYLILANVQLFYNAATLTAPRTCKIYLYRTNNSPGALDRATTTIPLRIATLVTDNGGSAVVPPILYETSRSDDKISIYGALSAPITSGFFQATEASIIAVRLY
jgi:hypothetical protein